MPWAPAQKNATCWECLEIARVLNEAYADDPHEMRRDVSRNSMDPQTRKAAGEALRSLIGGTEEDAERADELLERFRLQPVSYSPNIPPAARTAMVRFIQHAARTGHSLKPVVG
jgi:uncharacterized protein (UPF0147 family)